MQHDKRNCKFRLLKTEQLQMTTLLLARNVAMV